MSIGIRKHYREGLVLERVGDSPAVIVQDVVAEVVLSVGLVGFPSPCRSWGVSPRGEGCPREIRPM